MKKGFTLIELLVVVLIIGILAAIAVPQYQKAVMRSRMAEAVLNLRTLGDAQKRYILATGSPSADFAELDISLKDSCTGRICAVGKYAYYLGISDVAAYYESTGQDTAALTLVYYVEDFAASGAKEGEFACLGRGIEKYTSLCKTLAGPNAKTSNYFAGGIAYIFK